MKITYKRLLHEIENRPLAWTIGVYAGTPVMGLVVGKDLLLDGLLPSSIASPVSWLLIVGYLWLLVRVTAIFCVAHRNGLDRDSKDRGAPWPEGLRYGHGAGTKSSLSNISASVG